jgi:DNA-binding NarL/FixJ family response regulator
MIRVLIAEDHPLFRDGLEALLEGLPDVTVVDTTDTADGLVSLVGRCSPDLAIVDLSLADGNALGTLEQLHRIRPSCRILVLTSSDDDASVFAALRSGIHGYLLKSSTPEEIVRAVMAISAGDGVYDGAVVERITRHVATGGRASSSGVFPQLSQRERDVLALIARGMSNAEIADHYVLSLKTVRNHVSNVLTKLGAATRAEAIVAGREAGLAATPDPPVTRPAGS